VAKCQPAWGVCRVSEYLITVSILTAVLALLYLIALRIGEIEKDISCMHDQLHFFLEEMIKPIEEPESQNSEVPSPFTDWDES